MNGLTPPENLGPIMSNFQSLPARSGFAEAVRLLTSTGKYKLVAATNGGLDSTQGLLRGALGDSAASKWDVFSCDEIKVAKPNKEVYEKVWEKIGGKEQSAWFVASHTWCVLTLIHIPLFFLFQYLTELKSTIAGIYLQPRMQGLPLPLSCCQHSAPSTDLFVHSVASKRFF